MNAKLEVQKSVRSSFRFSDAIFTHVSSAYIFGIVLFRQFSKSLMYSMKSKGPKHDPLVEQQYSNFCFLFSYYFIEILLIGY